LPGIITDPVVLRRLLPKIRQQGCDWSIEEFGEGFSAVSAPIFDDTGQVCAALNIYAPIYYFPKDNRDETTEIILDVSCRLTAHLN
jgi:DNA-binding IclR family transcriptional regulator